MTEITLDYRPQPKQAEFHGCPADEVLYGGAAGGGKSRALRMEAAKVCLLYPGLHALILRRTYPELEMEIIRKFLEEVPAALGRYNDAKKRFVFANGSILQFGYAENDKDVLRYQGAEFGWLGFDELTHFTEYQYSYLVNSRLRSTDPAVWPRVRATSNPGGIGHAWVKARFIDPAPPGRVWRPDPVKRWTRCYIPARVVDNPALMTADPAYVERLQSLPEAERRALLDGDWDVFAGQVFAEFRRDIHVVTPEQLPIPYYARRMRWMDYGYAANTVCLWVAAWEDQGIPRLVIYREYIDRQQPPSEVARRVLALSQGEEIDYTVIDAAVWAKQQTGECIGETLAANGLLTIPSDKGPDSRIQGKMRLHEWLKPIQGPDGRLTARLLIYSTCTTTIQEIPTLVYDQHRIEDVDDNSGATGHADVYAAIRYGLMSRPEPETYVEPQGPATTVEERERRWLERMNQYEFGEVKRRSSDW